jgi:CheY-like chemotaxis protein
MKRIAVIDDRPDTVHVVGLLLTTSDVEVEAFTDPFLFLQRLLAGGFDLAIADVAMPGMDGYELCRRMHAIDPTLPALALTGSVSPEDHSKVMSSGFIAYVDKPIMDWDAFAAIVRKTTRDR